MTQERRALFLSLSESARLAHVAALEYAALKLRPSIASQRERAQTTTKRYSKGSTTSSGVAGPSSRSRGTASAHETDPTSFGVDEDAHDDDDINASRTREFNDYLAFTQESVAKSTEWRPFDMIFRSKEAYRGEMRRAGIDWRRELASQIQDPWDEEEQEHEDVEEVEEEEEEEEEEEVDENEYQDESDYPLPSDEDFEDEEYESKFHDKAEEDYERQFHPTSATTSSSSTTSSESSGTSSMIEQTMQIATLVLLQDHLSQCHPEIDPNSYSHSRSSESPHSSESSSPARPPTPSLSTEVLKPVRLFAPLLPGPVVRAPKRTLSKWEREAVNDVSPQDESESESEEEADQGWSLRRYRKKEAKEELERITKKFKREKEERDAKAEREKVTGMGALDDGPPFWLKPRLGIRVDFNEGDEEGEGERARRGSPLASVALPAAHRKGKGKGKAREADLIGPSTSMVGVATKAGKHVKGRKKK